MPFNYDETRSRDLVKNIHAGICLYRHQVDPDEIFSGFCTSKNPLGTVRGHYL